MKKLTTKIDEEMFSAVIKEEMSADTESVNIKNIIEVYNNGGDSLKALINNIFINLCGWSLKTLVDMTITGRTTRERG